MADNNVLKNEVCKLQESVYSLSFGEKKIVLDSANVLECQMTWDVNDISAMGSLSFQDTADMFSLTIPHPLMKISIKYKQYMSSGSKFDFEKDFSVIRIERGVKGSSKGIVKLEFMDECYYYMSRRYKSKGYKNTKFSAVLAEVLKECNSSVSLSAVETEVLHDSLVIPANKPFIHYLYNMEYRDGFNLINDKKTFNIMNASNYMNLLKKFSKSAAVKLTTSKETENNPFYIKEFKSLLLDSFTSNIMMPNSAVSNLNYLDKGIVVAPIMNSDIANRLKNDDMPMPYSTMTIGAKLYEYHTPNFSNVVNKLHSFKLLETFVLEVTVAGNIIYQLYDIVNVNISNTTDGMNSINLLNSGNYIILKIVDKIDGTYFNQIITLGRVGVKY